MDWICKCRNFWIFILSILKTSIYPITGICSLTLNLSNTLLILLSAWDRSRDSKAKRNLSKHMWRTFNISKFVLSRLLFCVTNWWNLSKNFFLKLCPIFDCSVHNFGPSWSKNLGRTLMKRQQKTDQGNNFLFYLKIIKELGYCVTIAPILSE